MDSIAMLPGELKCTKKRVETARDFAVPKILLFIIYLVLLISVSGCSYHWFWYEFDPYIVRKDNCELKFLLYRVEYSELEKNYLPTDEPTLDTMFELTILYNIKDSLSFEKNDLLINNVTIQIDSGVILQDLTRSIDISDARFGYYNEIEFQAFKYSGPTPKNIFVDLHLKILDKNTGQEVYVTTVHTQANLVRKSKSYLREFLDGR